MPVLVFLALICLIVAACLQRFADDRPQLVRTLDIALAISFIAALVAPRSAAWLPGQWTFDDISAAVFLSVAALILLTGLTEDRPRAWATVCRSGGLAMLAAQSQSVGVAVIAVVLNAVSLMVFDDASGTKRESFWRRNADRLLGILLFLCGIGLHGAVATDSIGGNAAAILLVCGLGGMLGWFPFPRAELHAQSTGSIKKVLSLRFLPGVTAAVFTMRLATTKPFGESQNMILGTAVLFSLAISSLRLGREHVLTRRASLMSLASFSFLVLPACLLNWEQMHPGFVAASTNLPQASSLWAAILLSETIGLALLLCGVRLLDHPANDGDFVDALAGVLWHRPVAGVTLLAGALTLSGLPPLPGFWWRISLIVALRVPYRRSFLTRLIEPHHGFSALLLVFVLIMIIHTVSHLQLARLVAFEESFRIRGRSDGVWPRLATCLAWLFLIGITLMPLAAAPALENWLSETPLNWFQNREGEAPAEPKRMGNRAIHAAQEDLRPPMPSMIRF